jgi:uncharacterized membrane protein YgaE (UPF0421/DUF939 family)
MFQTTAMMAVNMLIAAGITVWLAYAAFGTFAHSALFGFIVCVVCMQGNRTETLIRGLMNKVSRLE